MRKFLMAAALLGIAACGDKGTKAPDSTPTMAPTATTPPDTGMKKDTGMKMDSGMKKDTGMAAGVKKP